MTFQLPEVHVGDSVVWIPPGGQDHNAFAATVVGFGNNSVSLKVSHNSPQDMFKHDVPHKDDPRLVENVHLREEGTFDFSHEHKRLVAVEEWLKCLDSPDEEEIYVPKEADSAPIKSAMDLILTDATVEMLDGRVGVVETTPGAGWCGVRVDGEPELVKVRRGNLKVIEPQTA